MERVFLSMSFRPEDQHLVAAASAIIESHDLLVVTGKNLGGAPLTEEIRNRIDESDALVALCTFRDGRTGGTTSTWVRDELLYASSKNKPVLPLVEDGVTLDGLLHGQERAPFLRADPLGAFAKLATTLALWRQKAGVVLKAAIIPAEIALQLSKRQIMEVEFCVIRNGTATGWRPAPLVKEIGGLYAYLKGVPARDALIKVRAKLGRKRLESVAIAPHYYFTLEESSNA